MIREMIYAVASFLPPGFSRKDLVDAIRAYLPSANVDSILPSDYLCDGAVKSNPSNLGNQANYKTYPAVPGKARTEPLRIRGLTAQDSWGNRAAKGGAP